jgi:hypothetical protein
MNVRFFTTISPEPPLTMRSSLDLSHLKALGRPEGTLPTDVRSFFTPINSVLVKRPADRHRSADRTRAEHRWSVFVCQCQYTTKRDNLGE